MLEPANDTALARLFAEKTRSGQARWFTLPGGKTLFQAGEAPDQLFFLQAGRLGAFHHEEGQEPRFLGVIRPGEPAGEMALIAGTPHSAHVVALRDSEILCLDRDDFLQAAEHDAHVMLELARLTIQRTRAAKAPAGQPCVFGFHAVSDAAPIRDLVELIAQAVETMGYRVTVVGAEARLAPTEWFSNVEQDHDFVFYVAEYDERPWQAVMVRQVDRLFRIGRGDQAPPRIARGPADTLQAQRLIDLILIQPAGRRPAGSEPWIDAAGTSRLFHMRDGDASDIRRMARVLTGQSVGLVLSGGGARAYAHIGALRALREHGVPIDFVGGASMGAIIAAGIALGWDDAEMEGRIRAAFVESSPVDDIAFPMISMAQGEKVRTRLREHFGDEQIADLWLPFFCVSSNLTSGAYHLHGRGTVRHALRASISLPGVLPPVTLGGDVLVDGAVMKNFPADIMRSVHLGPIVGVDVSRGRSIAAADIIRPKSVLRWLISGEWRKGPPIVALMMRAATVTTGPDLIASRAASDVLVIPRLDGVDIRDWRAFEPAVKAGYEATIKVLDGLDGPVTTLRRRSGLDDIAIF